ncbi:MAG: ribosomal-processing cysteine protease Prp [Huintestinicola sp.]
MIKAVFFKENSNLSGFSLSGHAGYGTKGNDVACASVSSAAQLVCNTISEHFGDEADITVLENELTLKLKRGGENSVKLLDSFYEHLGFISEEFPRAVSISVKDI